MFTAYGIAGILGPQIAGYYKDTASGINEPIVWMTPFIIAGIACLIGAIIMMTAPVPDLQKSELKLRKA